MTKKDDATRFYSRRDSATALLRKLGVKPRDYDLFIEGQDDGKFLCHVTRAKQHLEEVANRAKQHKAANKRLPRTSKQRAKTTSKKKEARVTISSFARDLILNGKTNDQIFAALQKEFGTDRIDYSKRHYPAWYRCELRRKGELPPAFDPERQDSNAIHRLED